MKRFFTPCLLALAFSFSCPYKAQENSPVSPGADYTSIVKQWNDAHNDWKFKDLEKLYSEKVLFYGSSIPKQECIRYKTNLASPTQVYLQNIISGIEVTDIGKGITKCGFTKEVIIGDKKTEYPAYIVIKEINDTLRIICESDEITDATFGFNLSAELFEPIKNNSGLQQTETQEEKDGSYWIGYALGIAIVIVATGFVIYKRRKKDPAS